MKIKNYNKLKVGDIVKVVECDDDDCGCLGTEELSKDNDRIGKIVDRGVVTDFKIKTVNDSIPVFFFEKHLKFIGRESE